MKETIATQNQKDRYVLNIIPATYLQITSKRKSTAIPIDFKINNNSNVKRPGKQDEESTTKQKTTTINDSLYNINRNSRKTIHSVSNDDNTLPYAINKITDSVILLTEKTSMRETTGKKNNDIRLQTKLTANKTNFNKIVPSQKEY